jgi:oligopeptidase B
MFVVVGCKSVKEAGMENVPVARLEPKVLVEHGDERVDPYFWMKDRENPAVIDYLNAENRYLSNVLRHTEPLQERLFQEIVGRIKKDDDSVPVRVRDYFYYTRFVAGAEYPLLCSKKGSLEAAEEVMLDANVEAKGHEFFNLARSQVSSGQNILAFAADTMGRNFYAIRFLDLETRKFLPDIITNVTANFEWAEDNRTVYYARQDPGTLRAYQVFRHRLGTSQADDELIYEEKDEIYAVAVGKSKSRKYIFVAARHLQSTEFRFVDAHTGGDLKMIEPRRMNHIYSVDHMGDEFFIRTNLEAKNYRLMKTLVSAPAAGHWQEMISHRADVLVENFELFRDFLVVEERKDGLTQLRVRPWKGGSEHYVEFDEPAYTAGIGANPELDSGTLRFSYESLQTPRSVYDYDLASGRRILRKTEEVLGGFDRAHYVTERRFAAARDGVRVPVSIVYRKSTQLNGKSPLLLDGYGSYGISNDPDFNSARLSLLDRGFVYAIAHVRGGQEMGRQWYEDGRLLRKKNTFTDFIDCAEFLVKEGYADRDRLFAIGGSAGGLLMGAVMNMRPDLFRGVVAAVPFVDVVTTMLDDTIPLTTFEYEEWGNPHNKEFYDYMLSYSPYDNVTRQEYPNLLVVTGLHDSQVQYWEPAKWVAKLRVHSTGANRILMETDMESGHGGTTGRFKRHKRTALIYAFLLDLAGRNEP